MKPNDILTQFTIAQIVTLAIGILFAVKGAASFFEYFRDLYKKKFAKDYDKKRRIEESELHYQECLAQHRESLNLYNGLTEKIDLLSKTIDERFESLDARVDGLIQSDKHDIKQDIVKNYHYFVERQKWIDDYNLDSLELRYQDYKREGGNSYVGGLMKELRALPKHPPLN